MLEYGTDSGGSNMPNFMRAVNNLRTARSMSSFESSPCCTAFSTASRSVRICCSGHAQMMSIPDFTAAAIPCSIVSR